MATLTCVSCEHYQLVLPGQHMCKQPDIATNTVTGEIEFVDCQKERMLGGVCGPEGRKWQQKHPPLPPLPTAA